MAKSRRKPSDPQKIAEARARTVRAEDAKMRADGIDPKIARWGDEPIDDSQRATFERQGYAVVSRTRGAIADKTRSTVELDHRGRVVRTNKVDIWGELLARGSLSQAQHNAIRELQDLMLLRAGLAGRGEARAYDEGRSGGEGDALAYVRRRAEAGRQIDATLLLVGPPSSRLLQALLEPRLETATAVKLVRRCAQTARQVFRSTDGKRTGVGRERPVCQTLNPIEARHCSECGCEMEREPAGVDPKTDRAYEPRRGYFGVEIQTGEETWRETVARVRGVTNPVAQSTLLIEAAQALDEAGPSVARVMAWIAKEEDAKLRPAEMVA